ncbi:DNA repair exonuclease SbcCD ATPase subunit [Bordetella phage PY223]
MPGLRPRPTSPNESAMKITTENYRGIKSASLALEGIVLVAAPNASGKSAIAQAAGAVLAGQAVPIPGVLKTMAGMLVRNGASGGFAQLDAEGGTARVDWPRAALKTKGTPPQISAIAAGIESLTTAEPKRRAELLIELLQAHPTFEDLRARFAREGISEETARAVWETIDKQGWDAAHAQAKETGARLKGQWEAVTGERYGAKKAENFTPDEWEPELASASSELLTAALTDARDTLDGMIAVAALDDAERERLQSLADTLPERQAEHTAANEELQRAIAAHESVVASMNALRDPSKQQLHECPHCNGSLSIAGGKIIAGTPLTDDDIAKWNAAQDAVAQAREVGVQARARVNVARVAMLDAEGASKKLDECKDGNATHAQVQHAREAVTIAQGRLDAFTSKTRADRLQNSILQNVAIVSALDTAGVRQDKLNESVDSFLTVSVAPLSVAAGWHKLEISHDMLLSYGGRAWPLLSESERYRARVLLQVAIALREGSSALVIDAADILDKAGRNGLIALLRHAALPALVCMTIPTPKEVPDLKAAGLGESLWIRDGVTVPLSQARQHA